MGTLDGKVALVTGGNSGIGLATAKQLVHEGAYVFITGRRGAELAAAVKGIGRNVTGVQGDVSNVADVERLFAQIKQEKGTLDIVFANAGIVRYAALGAISEEFFDSIFDTNVKGVLFRIQNALPLLPNGASIILSASMVSESVFEVLDDRLEVSLLRNGHDQSLEVVDDVPRDGSRRLEAPARILEFHRHKRGPPNARF